MEEQQCDYGGQLVDCQDPATYSEQHDRWLCDRHLARNPRSHSETYA